MAGHIKMFSTIKGVFIILRKAMVISVRDFSTFDLYTQSLFFFIIVILLCTILQQNQVTYTTYKITTILLIQTKLKKNYNQLLLLLKHYSNKVNISGKKIYIKGHEILN